MGRGLRWSGLVLVMSLLSFQNGAAQDSACCVIVPDGFSGVRVDRAPIMVNSDEVVDSLRANRLEGGAVTTRYLAAVVWLHVAADGSVSETRIHRSSGSESMDANFLRAASIAQFTPALVAEEPVAVWLQMPISIQPGG